MPLASGTVDSGVLFETCHDRIYRYVLSMVRDAAEAEDLTQETFLRAYRGGDSLRDQEAVRGWLYRIATNVCLDRLRQRKPVLSFESDQDESGIPKPVSKSPSPLAILESKETSACVQRCLEFLPNTYRAAILLHEAHSLSAREIADLLGITIATVKIRLHRAHAKLQRVMERGCTVSEDGSGKPRCHPKPY